jgi:signal transduction histidine kinase
LLTDAWAAAAAQGTLSDVAGRFRQLGSVSQQALRGMRLLIHQLRPPALEEVGLIGALQRRVEMVEQRFGIATRIVVEGDLTKLPPVVEEQLFAVAQEALNNALRHAGAGTVHISIQMVHGSIMLAVQDDGHGFDPTVQTAGLGLVTMRERTASINGTLVINTALWRGTTVQITAPVKHDVAKKGNASPLLSL